MTEHFTSLKAIMYERISSPLISSFILSWSTWNIKAIIIVFKGNDWSDINYNLENYNTVAGSESFGILLNNFLIPALLTYLFLYVVPEISKRVYSQHLTNLKELKELKVEIENQKPITRKEANKLYATLESIEEEHNERISTFQKRIEELEKELDSAREKVKNQQKTEETLKNKISKIQLTTEKSAKELDEKLSKISIKDPKVKLKPLKKLSKNILYALQETGAMTTKSLSEWLQKNSDVHFDSQSLSYELNGLIPINFISEHNPTKPGLKNYKITEIGERYIESNSNQFSEVSLGLSRGIAF